MINLSITYQPFSFLPFSRKLAGSFPSAIGELNPRQLVAVASLTKNAISENNFLRILTGFSRFTIAKLDAFHRYTLMNLFTFFTEIKYHSEFILPFIETPDGKLYCPKPKLTGLSIAQFIFIENFFLSYQLNNEPEDLHKFVASLYLPGNSNFSENLVKSSALSLSRVKPEILEAVMINYIFVKEWLTLAYPMIFVRQEETHSNHKEKKPADNSAWLKIFENIVGDDIINYDRYALMPVHHVFRWMTAKIKENYKRK